MSDQEQVFEVIITNDIDYSEDDIRAALSGNTEGLCPHAFNIEVKEQT
jgi:hypothetical protein